MDPLQGLDPIADPPEDAAERELCAAFERETDQHWQDVMLRLLAASRQGTLPAGRAMRLAESITGRFRALRAVLVDLDPDEDDNDGADFAGPRRGRGVRVARRPGDTEMVENLVGGLSGMANTHELNALAGLVSSRNPEIRRLAEARVIGLLQDRAGRPEPARGEPEPERAPEPEPVLEAAPLETTPLLDAAVQAESDRFLARWRQTEAPPPSPDADDIPF